MFTVNRYFAVFVYWWTKCWWRLRPLLQTHKLTFLTNAHPFVWEKGWGGDQGEQCNWNSECFVIPGDICISPEGPPPELILFLDPFSLLCPLSLFEEEGV